MKRILEAIERERAKWAGTPIAVPTIWPNTRDAFFAVLDRIAKDVKDLEAPGDGGEFEKEKWSFNVTDLSGFYNKLANRHNAAIDRLIAAHAADLRAAEARNSASEDDLHKKINLLEQALFDAEARHRRKVQALVEALQYAVKYVDLPQIRALIERRMEGGEE